MANHRRHGLGDTPEYAVWATIKSKCLSSSNPAYPRFGGRGIRLHEPWREFSTFFREVGPRPDSSYRLERLDKDGHFEPGNVQWKVTSHSRAQAPKNPPVKALQLVGKTFHCLEVLGVAPYQRGDGKRFYKARVRCRCGTEFEIFQSALGQTVSCGCSRDFSKVTGENNYHFTGHGEIRGGYWQKVQEGARIRGLSFDLAIEAAWELFLKQKRCCIFSGVPLQFGPNQTTRREHSRTASLDRIDPAQGYFLGNVQWVHKDLNLMRMDLGVEEFVQWCRRVAANHPLSTVEEGTNP